MRHRILLLTAMMLMAAATMGAKKFTLVIDAGHGGHDAGAIGAITKEKTINLNVALAFGQLVERNCPDVKVIYTRKTDVFVPLHTRADIANHNKADLFISIHTNSLPRGRTARGMETYTLGMHRASDNLDVAKRENSVILIEKDYKQHYEGFDPNSSESYIMFEFIQDHNMAQSVELAKYMQRRTCSIANRPNKGVKQAGFLVLRETSMPSCLIELGFISTPDEERYLNSTTGVSQLGQGIYQAFIDYKRRYDGGQTVIDQPKPQPPVAEQPKTEPPVAEQPQPQQSVIAADAPLFKVQVMTASSKTKNMPAQLKGQEDVGYYQEGGLNKYTVGASTDYNEINRLRKSLLAKFPQAFVIAFKNGEKMDVRQAIKEFMNNKSK